MAMSAGTSSSLLVLHISLSSSSSLRSPLYSPSGSLGCRRVARHCAVSLLRENATPSFSSPNRVARHRTVSSSSNAYAAPGILLGRHRPVAWCAESFRPTRLTREFVTGKFDPKKVSGRRSQWLLIINCQVYLFLLSLQNALSSSLRGNATASFSPMCIPTVNDDDEGFVESLNAFE